MPKSKIVTRTVMGLAAVFAAVAAGASLEWSGYKPFDRDQGPNLLCTIDPTCRQMNDAEIAMAKDLYGDSINYNSVKIFDRRYMGFMGKGRWMSPNGSIYNDIVAERGFDYTKTSWQRRSLMHELAHVWQVQRGVDVRHEAVIAYVQSGFNYSATYGYTLNDHPWFLSYNLEQQADMLEDYDALRRKFREDIAGKAMDTPKRYGGDFTAQAKQTCKALAAYEQKIEQVLPLTPQEGCDYFRRPAKTPKPVQS
jgi:hypothetical protein